MLKSVKKLEGSDISQEIFLMGGFANPPSLRSYLTRELAVIRNYNGDKIKMTIPQAGAYVLKKDPSNLED
jgi:hypothetical protein